MSEFAIRLKEARDGAGMSQKEVADAVGVTPSAYANYEQGTREPAFKVLVKICEALDISADYLLGIEDWI